MNFLYTDDINEVKNILNSLEEKIIIHEVNNQKYIYLKFPIERFPNMNVKIAKFASLINGTQYTEYILTNADNYIIYQYFYQIFY